LVGTWPTEHSVLDLEMTSATLVMHTLWPSVCVLGTAASKAAAMASSTVLGTP
jgi:hypothetical protein